MSSIRFIGCFFVLAAGLCAASVSQAASLEQAFAQQEQIEISSVLVGGKPVGDSCGRVCEIWEFNWSAAFVCRALGYSRVVSFKTEECTEREIVMPRGPSGPGAVYFEPGRCSGEPGEPEGFFFTSVTCAK
jgi:hypothetical protein